MDCTGDINFKESEIEDLTATIARNSLRAFMDKIGGPLRDSYLASLQAHIITETSQTDFASFIIGIFGFGTFISEMLNYSNVNFFNQPTENKDSYQEETEITIKNLKIEKAKLHNQLEECKNDHTKSKNNIDQQRLNEKTNLLTILIEKLDSELGAETTNINLIDINEKDINFNDVTLSKTPSYDGKITSSINEHPTMEDPSIWDTRYVLNNPYLMTLFSELGTPYALQFCGFLLESSIPGITNIMSNAPATSDTAREVLYKLFIQQGAAMGTIAQGKYGEEYDIAAEKNIENSNQYLANAANKINFESQNNAVNYLNQYDKIIKSNEQIISDTFNQRVIKALVPVSTNSHYQVRVYPLKNADSTNFGDNGNTHTYIPFAESTNNNENVEFKAGGKLSENEFIVSKGSGSVLSIQSSDSRENIISAEVHDDMLYIRKTFKDNEISKDTLYELNTHGKHIIMNFC